MMDARAPKDVITVSLPIAIFTVPIERRRKMWNNRGDKVERIYDALEAAGWDHKRVFRGPVALTIRAAYLPEPRGLPKFKREALERGETAWRQGGPQLGALADIVVDATQLDHGQIVRMVIERVYGGRAAHRHYDRRPSWGKEGLARVLA